ncbi:YifB family Mg chelatase-like AAA ATPase, partial [Candidatus Saccharibacteria bacterium]|nr:YifB family Mg chelatase-like AAA ATPase [Candidatus Saccharibacteria bacterium]
MKSRGAISLGYECVLIDVECHISNNLPGITIVGLATRSVDESRERIRAAFSASGLELPRRKILINLAPADIAKDDSGLDFAIAAAIIGKDMAKGLGNSAYIGELGLDGILKPVRGLVGKLLEARSQGVDSVYVPEVMSEQAALVPGIKIYPIKNLRQFVSIIQGEEIQLVRSSSSKNAPKREYLLDDIVGQAHAKRALLVAAAGRHNLHMYGPPGTGKTMLAKAASELLPNLSREESLVVTHIHSLATHESDAIIDQAPFRAPHHTASDISIIGGGSHARPGEISLAHLGILMLDELPEYSKSTLEALRQPLEDKRVTVSRARVSTTYPADFMLIATSNPCPCGFYGSDKPCSCSPYEIIRYQKRLSGPIMDRIDMHIQVNAIDPEKLL